MSQIPLKLPRPQETYSPTHEDQRNRAIEQADAENQKVYKDILIIDRRLRIADPDGILWTLSVTRDGKLVLSSETGAVADFLLEDMTVVGEGTVT